MKYFFNKIYLYTVLISFLPAVRPSYGQVNTTLGSAIYNIGDNIGASLGLLEILSYVIGITFGIIGVIKLKEYSDAPGKIAFKDPLIRIIVGAFFIILPTFIGVIIASTIGGGGGLDIHEMDLSM
jgi:hypothetical protein